MEGIDPGAKDFLENPDVGAVIVSTQDFDLVRLEVLEEYPSRKKRKTRFAATVKFPGRMTQKSYDRMMNQAAKESKTKPQKGFRAGQVPPYYGSMIRSFLADDFPKMMVKELPGIFEQEFKALELLTLADELTTTERRDELREKFTPGEEFNFTYHVEAIEPFDPTGTLVQMREASGDTGESMSTKEIQQLAKAISDQKDKIRVGGGKKS